MALFYDHDTSRSVSAKGDPYLVPTHGSYECVQDFEFRIGELTNASLGQAFHITKRAVGTSFDFPLLGSFRICLFKHDKSSLRLSVSKTNDDPYFYELKATMMKADGEILTPCDERAFLHSGPSCWEGTFKTSRLLQWPIKIRIQLTLVLKKQNLELFPAMKQLLKTNQTLSDLLMFSGPVDVTFHIGERQFMAHQSVLTKKSSVFATMFSSQLKEAKSKEVVVEDSSFEGFVEFIRYLYTEMVEEKTFDCHWAELLDLAEKYDVAGLKRACSAYSVRKLNTETCLEHYAAAVKYSLDEVKEKIAAFIVANAKRVTASSKWKSFAKEMPTHAADLALRAIQRS